MPQLVIARRGHAAAMRRARTAVTPARRAFALRQAAQWRRVVAAYL